MAFNPFILRSVNSVFNITRKCHFQLRYNIINKRLYSAGRPNKTSTFRLTLVGVSVGALVGTGYSITKLNQPNIHISNEEIVMPLIADVPKFQPSRKILIPNDTTGLKLTLYQYQTCPFCCKVRAFLDYYGISYNVVEVDPVLRQSIKWSQYKKVPILVAQTKDGYQQLNDSAMIISALSSFLTDKDKKLTEFAKYYPVIKYTEKDGAVKSEVMNRYFLMLDGTIPKNKTNEDVINERKLRKWADDVLVHTLSPNVYRTPDEALQAFNWFSEVGDWEKHFPTWERMIIIYVGAFAMWLIGKRLKTRHNLKDDVRISLYDECNYWVKLLKNKGTPFMGGSSPDLSDLAVYGVLNSIEGCDAFQDLLKHSSITKWYKAMKEVVQNHEGLKHI